jgi:P-type conjugative transfer protein TrbJ
MKKSIAIVSALLFALLSLARPAGAQMVVSDPSTEWSTYATYYQTAQTAYSDAQTALHAVSMDMQALKDGTLNTNNAYTSLDSDIAKLTSDLNADPNGAGDTNSNSVNNANLESDFQKNNPGYSPDDSSNPNDQRTAASTLTKLEGILQALKVNKSAFARANASTAIVNTLQAQNDSAAGTDQLLQTTNALLAEAVKDLDLQAASYAVNMQAMLADQADQTELSSVSTTGFEQQQVNNATEFSAPSAVSHL